ncbi:sulfurtransferase complex subunit TusB [Aliiglaciecola sp. M165]|uniref:sulfurtransferase complex subunit TusB n=1 Tax=Aliiglaciecola sp. M165 TaxID=2593649 RepID=UPI00117F5BB2|nr:sulfurtransferase complex subunit TusB [Aliiglaciecola sp. M165]TRY30153.1 sulfurtransferase complex subunit TusB [Aliiglaciecola sp. M165]
MILHKFVSSPFSCQTIDQTISRISVEDAVILMEDAVYVLNDSKLLQALMNATDNVHVLESDAKARGVSVSKVRNINYLELVDLVIDHDNVIAW